MGQALLYPAAGAKTPIPGNASALISTTSKVRGFNFAGAGSRGLVVNGNAWSPAVQFGTLSTDPLANTSVTAAVADQEAGGAAPSLVEIDSAGNQQLGYGRVRWEASTGWLYMHHKAGDALVSSNPRVQLYCHRLQHCTLYHRYYFAFSLGTPEMPWPAYQATSNLNAALLFQIKNDAQEPNITLDVVTAASGDTTKRDLIMTYRTVAGVGTTELARLRDIEIGRTYYNIVDTFIDWRDAASGGKPYLAWWVNGQQMVLNGASTVFRGNTAFADAATVARPMIGIYRYAWATKASDGAGITVPCFRVEQSMTPPPMNTIGVAAFGMPNNVLV